MNKWNLQFKSLKFKKNNFNYKIKILFSIAIKLAKISLFFILEQGYFENQAYKRKKQ